MARIEGESIVWIFMHLVCLVLTIIFRKRFSCDFYTYIGGGIILLGLIIWISAKNAMGQIKVGIIPYKFVKSGIYSKIRHPLYLGVKLIFLGLAISLRSIIGLLVVLIVLVLWHYWREKQEEKFLIKRYGKRYLDYKKKTFF